VNREEFLARVREATIAGRAHRVHIDPTLPSSVGYVGGGEDLAESLAAEINAVGGVAKVVENLDAARDVLLELLELYEPGSALCWSHPLLERLGLASILAEQGVAQLDYDSLSELPPAAQRDKLIAADIGITSVSYAVAETGSLVVASRAGQERLASLLPPVHIAIVERSQIVPDLFDLFAILGTQIDTGLPTNIAFITGPSKTGDIELTLITGVHGPGKWHVIVIR
jgi:L-lactate dehydrogenase complex protein LldG